MSTETQEHAKIEQLQHASPDEIEVAAGREREDLQGWVPEMASEGELREALEKAFDYRGDVTITKKDGSVVEGYVFDRRSGATLASSAVRVLLPGSSQKITIPYSEIAALAFSGRDTAAGKSFEAWVKKYWEKKAAGEKGIGIEPEKLD
ncbi:MAG TPA: hypothetical protein VF126_05755 [Acidobacteriaceae bacterium]